MDAVYIKLQQQVETRNSTVGGGISATAGRTVRTTTTAINTASPRLAEDLSAVRKRTLSTMSKPNISSMPESSSGATNDPQSSITNTDTSPHESKRRMTAKDRIDMTPVLSDSFATLRAPESPLDAENSKSTAAPVLDEPPTRFGLGLSTPSSSAAATTIALEPSSSMLIDVQAAQVANEINPLSLPSPSLSPVTGSLRKHKDEDYFSSKPHVVETHETIPEVALTSHSVMMSIPSMVDSFDALPENVKDYVMYQFLRRCSKKSLSIVASTVMPALRCDFLALLPQELIANILRYLDVKSLCVAAQVSKTWKSAIDGSPYTWRKLLESDGIKADGDEMERAIREGWCMEGWGTTAEEDVGPVAESSSSEAPAATIEESSGRRLSKRKLSESAESMLAAAVEAAVTSTGTQIGSQKLPYPNMFKAIYRRHYLINKNWMSPNSTPRHLSLPGPGNVVVTCLQFDSEKIITGYNDLRINVYDAKAGHLRTRLDGHEGGVWAMQYVGNTLVSGSTDRTVRVWDIERGVCTHIFYGHTSTVRCLQIVEPVCTGYTTDGKPIMEPKEPIIVTGSRDSTLRIWRLPKIGVDDEYLPTSATPEYDSDPFFLRALNGHSHSVRAISGYGDTLVSGSYDTFVRVWKISTGECLFRLAGHSAKVYSVVIDPKRKRCISGSMDWLVKIWSLETGECLYTLDGHTSLVGLLDLNRTALVSAAADSTLRVWEPETGAFVYKLEGHTGAITCFQHDAHKVISGSDGTLKLWNIKTGRVVKDLLSDLNRVWQVRFDERRCVAAVQRGQDTSIEVS